MKETKGTVHILKSFCLKCAPVRDREMRTRLHISPVRRGVCPTFAQRGYERRLAPVAGDYLRRHLVHQDHLGMDAKQKESACFGKQGLAASETGQVLIVVSKI